MASSRSGRLKRKLSEDDSSLEISLETAFEIKCYGEKGRGVQTNIFLPKGIPLLQYKGELISEAEGERRELKGSTGFRFFFKSSGSTFCIDASKENGSFGRLVNHGSGKEANAKVKFHKETLWIFSLRDIHPGEEILYDYGIRPLPWTKKQTRQEVDMAKKIKLFVVASGFDMSKTAKLYSRELKEIVFQKEIDENTTHVVMHTVRKTSHVVDRTLKYFIGISKGLWIVNKGWLEDSLKARRILPEDDYEISGDSFRDNHEGPKKARKHSSQLFKDYQFFLKNFKSEGDLTQENVENLIKNSGGMVGNLNDIREKKMFANFAVVLYNGDEMLEDTIQEPPDIPCVSLYWFLDSLSSYTVLDKDNYILKQECVLEEYRCGVDCDDLDEDDDFNDHDDDNGDKDYEPDDDSESSDRESSDEEEKERDQNLDAETNLIQNKESEYFDHCQYVSDTDHEKSDDEGEKQSKISCEGIEIGDGGEDALSKVYPAITPKVIIQERSSNGVKQQKYFACLYCEKLFTKLPRHLTRAHFFEEKVKEALKLPLKSNERRKAWLAIQQEGNYNHNFQVLSKGCGLLIPKYRSRGQTKKVEDYVPCEFCFGLYLKRDLWKHHTKCKNSIVNAKEGSTRGKPVANGKLLLPSKSDVEVNENILVKMRDDEIKAVITNDDTLLEFASRMFEQNGHLQHRHQYIAQRLRELARMLIAMKDTCATIDSIEKCLDPSNWEEIIKAVKLVSGFNNKTGQYSTPSLPLRLGQSLVKCAKIHKTRSLVNSNEDVRRKMDSFIELHENEWNSRIAAKCHSTLHLAKLNKPQLLPVTKDVQTLHRYLNEESKRLRKDYTVSDYRTFAEICLAQIILFNRKRSGEAERIRIEDFENSVTNTEIDSAVFNSLTPLEKEIIKSHKRIEIVGKRGSKVPVILTDDMVENLNILLNRRKDINIDSNFLFGKANSQFPIRGSDALRNVAVACGAANPSLLTSTKLRKQLATLSQVLGLNEHGQDALAKFMGHDIRIHRSYYELPENTIQLAKMAKVLHSINDGKDINIEDTEVTEDDVINEDSSDSDVEEINGDIQQDTVKVVGEYSKRKQRPTCSRSQGSKSWSKAEQEAVLRHLAQHILSEKLPGKHQCEEVKRKEAILSQRSWQQIKFFIRNRITSKNRRKNPLLMPFQK